MNNKKIILSILTVSILFFFTGCATSTPKSNLSAGEAQRTLQQGISTKPDVIKALGAPNIHYKKKDGSEMWTYESVAMVQYEMSFGIGGGGFGTGTPVGGVISGGGSKSSSSQKTLTITVYFDSDGVVQSYETMETHF